MSTTLQPTLQSTRNYFLDLWRGFAITGVLIAYIMWNLGNLPEKDWSSVDKIIAEFTRIFIDGKFYTTLSILFGYGFYLQVEKSRLNHQSVVPFALRRIFLLLLIGTIHAVLLRRGDILMPYAICSIYLFFARNAGNKTLIALMIFCFLFPLLYYQFIHWLGYKNRPWEADSGSYLHYMWVAFRNFHNPVYFFVQVFDYFFLFLLGFYAAKNNWLQKLSRHPNQLLLLFIIGVALGTGMYYAMETGDKWFTKWFGAYNKMSFGEKMISGYAGSLFYLLHRGLLVVGYFAGLYFLYQRSFKMTAFVNMGRMALSNYLLQSLIMIPVCFIFGLFGKFTPVTVMAWSAGIWVAQAIFSTWWLKYYNFGPIEWLLRSFTYRRWQVIKTESPS